MFLAQAQSSKNSHISETSSLVSQGQMERCEYQQAFVEARSRGIATFETSTRRVNNLIKSYMSLDSSSLTKLKSLAKKLISAKGKTTNDSLIIDVLRDKVLSAYGWRLSEETRTLPYYLGLSGKEKAKASHSVRSELAKCEKSSKFYFKLKSKLEESTGKSGSSIGEDSFLGNMGQAEYGLPPNQSSCCRFLSCLCCVPSYAENHYKTPSYTYSSKPIPYQPSYHWAPQTVVHSVIGGGTTSSVDYNVTKFY